MKSARAAATAVLLAGFFSVITCLACGGPSEQREALEQAGIVQPKRGSPEVGAKAAFEVWVQLASIPYRNERYTLLSNDGTYARVRVVAEFRKTAESAWLENEAEVEVRKVGGDWQVSSTWLDFQPTAAERQRLGATATARTHIGQVTATAAAEAWNTAATAAAEAGNATATADTVARSATATVAAEAAMTTVAAQAQADATSTAEVMNRQLENLYDQAESAYRQSDEWLAAYTFQQVATLRPGYRDVSDRLTELSSHVGYIYYEFQDQIWVIPGTGGTPESLTVGFKPTLSADGERMAFCDPNDELLFGNPTGPYTTFGTWEGCGLFGGVTNFALSPDGTQIIAAGLSREDSSRSAVTIIDTNKGSMHDLDIPGLRVLAWTGWAPDGSRLCVSATSEAFGPGLYIVNADGTGLGKLLTTRAIGPFERCAWSPDGGRIAFSSFFDGLGIIPADAALGGTPVLKLQCGAMPYWSPDGKKLTVTSNQDQSLMVVNPDCSDPVNLGVRGYYPTWVP